MGRVRSKTRGHATAAPQGRSRVAGKREPCRAFFEALLRQNPDTAPFELWYALADADDVPVHLSAIADVSFRLGFTFKKRSVATEPRRGKVRHLRAEWPIHRAPVLAAFAERIVVIDETTTKTTPTSARVYHLRRAADIGRSFRRPGATP